jgi:hypothetical protein
VENSNRNSNKIENLAVNVVTSAFCGLVLIGVFGFPSVFGCFFFFFPVLVSFLYIFYILRGAFTLFINFSTYLSKKKKVVTSSNLMEVKDYSPLLHNFILRIKSGDQIWMVFLSTLLARRVVAWVERAFEEMEVFDPVKDLNGDKALGPNESSMAFF